MQERILPEDGAAVRAAPAGCGASPRPSPASPAAPTNCRRLRELPRFFSIPFILAVSSHGFPEPILHQGGSFSTTRTKDLVCPLERTGIAHMIPGGFRIP